MTVCEITLFLLLGAFLGVVGQVARVVVGLKKNIDKSSQGESWEKLCLQHPVIFSDFTGHQLFSFGKELIIIINFHRKNAFWNAVHG